MTEPRITHTVLPGAGWYIARTDHRNGTVWSEPVLGWLVESTVNIDQPGDPDTPTCFGVAITVGSHVGETLIDDDRDAVYWHPDHQDVVTPPAVINAALARAARRSRKTEP